MVFKKQNQAALLNRVIARWRVRKALVGQWFNWPYGPLLENEQHMKFAAEWLAAAHDATPDGGVSAQFSLSKGCDVSYPETTGYIIPTLLNYFHFTGQTVWRNRAIRMANWLLSTQLSNGAFPLRSDLATPAVFDTGQVLFGLIGAFHETGATKYLNAAARAAQWLISIQDLTGAWRRHSYNGIPHTYHTRVAWALLTVYQDLNDNALLLAAKNNLAWAMTQQLENGWFRNNVFVTDESPLLHTIAYAARGFLEAGRILKQPELMQAAAKTADALLTKQQKGGALHGRHNQSWQPTVRWTCLTGNAQIAIVWLKLFAMSGNKAYLEAARKMNLFLKNKQNLWSRNPGMRGGIAGSHPIKGDYMPFAYPNWATKFFLDALMLESRASATHDASVHTLISNMEVAG